MQKKHLYLKKTHYTEVFSFLRIIWLYCCHLWIDRTGRDTTGCHVYVSYNSIAVTHQLTERSGPLVSSYTDIMVIINSIVSFLLFVSYNSVADTYESSGAVETPCFYTDIMVIINDIFSSMFLITLLLSLINWQRSRDPWFRHIQISW